MFERRLKILLGLLAGFTLLLLLRAGWLQVVQGAQWQKRAAESARRTAYLESFRGAIRDFQGRIIAEDAPCIDAALDYRAIDIDAKESQEWLRIHARNRLTARGLLKGDKDVRTRMVDAEVAQIKQDIQFLWATFAKVSGKTPDEIEQVRQSILRRVQMRLRFVWYKRYEEARDKHDSEHKEPPSGWYRWLMDDSAEGPQIESFKLTVSEQTETHAVLHNIDNEAYLKLDKLRERCPGLELKKGTRRNYPYGDIACHVIGNLTPVSREDLEAQAQAQMSLDDPRRYTYNDTIGRTGVERMAERILRGSRGYVIRQTGGDAVIESVAAVPGQDVRLTIDMDLQKQIQAAFMRYEETGDKNNPGADLRVAQMRFHEMHGAAVVIDVPTGQVRAMVSYPTFDLNQLDTLYAQLARDAINQPLMNRATQQTLEPGSTVKPLVGLSAITAGLMRIDETIECSGFFKWRGGVLKQGRCWTMSKFNIAHHAIPNAAPHPTGFLTFVDALERSCNVFFETLADRLGTEGLRHWMMEFGLGRLTEVGIAENKGRVPGDTGANPGPAATWFAGIGQSDVLATPIQMANVAATIARRGVWIRPHLNVAETPDVQRHDLHLNPAAIDAAHVGMINVVNGAAGTGTILHRPDMVVAAKTGTAQAHEFSVVLRDEQGQRIRDENGRVKREQFKPSSPDAPNPKMPWYRGAGTSGTELGHAWFIGFAPARDPKIAFAVMVEYGGSGGKDAGPIAQAILDACVQHGYLSVTK